MLAERCELKGRTYEFRDGLSGEFRGEVVENGKGVRNMKAGGI